MDLWKKTVSGRKEGGLKGCFHGNKRIEPQKTASVSAWRHLDLQDLDMVFCGSIFFPKKIEIRVGVANCIYVSDVHKGIGKEFLLTCHIVCYLNCWVCTEQDLRTSFVALSKRTVTPVVLSGQKRNSIRSLM